MSASTPKPSSANPPVGPPLWMNFLSGPLGGGLDLGLLILRLGFGLMLLIGHGIDKWQKYNEYLERGFLDPFGMGMANSLTAAAISETVMAGLVAVGLLTRLACIPLVVTFAVAAFIAHAKDPLFMGGGAAKEPALLYGLAFLTLMFTGPGKFSIDGLMTLPRKER